MSIHEAKIAVRLFNLCLYAGDKRTVPVGENVDFIQSQCLDGEFNGKYVKVRGPNKVEVGEFSGYTAIDPQIIEGGEINKNPLVKRTRFYWKSD